MLEFYFDMFKDGIIEAILGILLTMCVLAVAGMILCGIYYVADSVFRPEYEGTGNVIEKTFTPAHTTTVMIYNAVTKTNMPQIVRHPDDWSVSIKIDGLIGVVSIAKDVYSKLKKGCKVRVKYATGRINTKNVYIKKISTLPI